MQMAPDPTGEMIAWITMAAVTALVSAIGIFTTWKRHR
jgi:hypothetical protein